MKTGRGKKEEKNLFSWVHQYITEEKKKRLETGNTSSSMFKHVLNPTRRLQSFLI